MHINPYGRDAIDLVVDLANYRPDSIEDLVTRCRGAGVVVDMPVDERDLAATLALVDQWCQVVDTPEEQQRADLVNQMLAEASTYPRMTDHAGEGWHLHHRDDDVPPAHVLRAITVVGTATHLT